MEVFVSLTNLIDICEFYMNYYFILPFTFLQSANMLKIKIK